VDACEPRVYDTSDAQHGNRPICPARAAIPDENEHVIYAVVGLVRPPGREVLGLRLLRSSAGKAALWTKRVFFSDEREQVLLEQLYFEQLGDIGLDRI